MSTGSLGEDHSFLFFFFLILGHTITLTGCLNLIVIIVSGWELFFS